MIAGGNGAVAPSSPRSAPALLPGGEKNKRGALCSKQYLRKNTAARQISSPRRREGGPQGRMRWACSPFAPKGEDNSASPLLHFQLLTRKHLPAYPRPPIPLHHLSCNRNGRAIRATLFADQLPASTSMVLADHVSERRPAMPAAGGADPVGAVKRLSPMGPAFRSEKCSPANAGLSTTLHSHPHLPGCRFTRRRETAAATFACLKRFGYLNRVAETLQILHAAAVPDCRLGLNRCASSDVR